MTENTSQSAESFPVPLIEVGDFVRLKEPYPVSNLALNDDGLAEMIVALCLNRYRENPEIIPDQNGQRTYLENKLDNGKQIRPSFFKDMDGFSDLFQWTHGIVVEVVSRYQATHLTPYYLDKYREAGEWPAQRVSIHPFNPKYGMIKVGGHPTEPGKPEFVDTHARELILIHKSEDSWGNEFILDIEEAYEVFGITSF